MFPCRRVSKPFIKKNDPKNEALAKLGMMNLSPQRSVSSLLSGYFRSSAERAHPSHFQQAGISLVLQQQPGDFWLGCEITGSSHMVLPTLDWSQSVKSSEVLKERLWSSNCYCQMLKADLEASNSCSPCLAPRLWLVNILFSLPNWRL